MRDGVAIAVAIFLSLVWYVGQLGFYSDDWAFLGLYATAADQSVRGLFNASWSPQHAMRPLQLGLCAILYRFFGMDVLWYHLVNGLLILVNPLLVYAIARRMRAARRVAVATALVYGLLPSFSTDRFWYVAFAITLSMTACLASIYADLRAAESPLRRGIAWKIAAAAALVVSGLSYEVAMPVLLVVPVLIACRLWQEQRPVTRQRMIYLGALVAINIVLISGVSRFKLQTTVRLGAEQGLRAQVVEISRNALRRDVPHGGYGLNVFNAVRVHFVEYGVKLPVNALAVLRSTPLAPVVLTLLVALAVFGYLASAFRDEAWPSRREWTVLTGGGIAVFSLGYAIFLTNYNVQFTTTGIANRSAIAAALGAAMCLVGVTGVVVGLLPTTGARNLVFAAAIATVAASGVLIINATAARWITAYQIERDVLADIHRTLPVLPPNSTMILDGVCPYVGPAIVFESDWDLKGALQVMYRDRSVAANVVTPQIEFGEQGLTFRLYGQPTRYAYSPALFLYHAGSGAIQPLPDASAARRHLSRAISVRSCPPGQEGIGQELF